MWIGAANDERQMAAGADPERVTQHSSTVAIEKAKAVCRRCEVIEACLSWAMESGKDDGVWGGLSDDERRALKRRVARARRADPVAVGL